MFRIKSINNEANRKVAKVEADKLLLAVHFCGFFLVTISEKICDYEKKMQCVKEHSVTVADLFYHTKPARKP